MAIPGSNTLEPTTSRERLLVGALLCVALALRLVYLREFQQQTLFEELQLDEANYDAWAVRIAGGDVLGEGTFTANPLAPYLLGASYAAVGRDLLVVRGCQMVAGTAACGLLYALTRSACGARAAVAALGLAAIYGPFVHTSANLVAEGWVVLLVAAGLLALVRSDGPGGHAVAGACLALASLGRPNLLALVPLLPLAREVEIGSAAASARARRIAGWMLGVVLVLGPVLARNIDRGGEAVLVTAHGGVNLWIGNNPDADGFFLTPPGSRLAGGQEELITSSIAVASRAEGRELTASEASRWWTRRAVRFAVEQPLAFARLTLQKARWYCNAYEAPLESNYAWSRGQSVALGHGTIGIALVGPLALGGMLAASGRWRRWAVLYAFVLVYSATVIATFVSMRYRLPVLVGALPFAGLALDLAWQSLRSRDLRRALPLLVGVVVGIPVFQLPLPAGHADRDLAYHEFLLGNAELDAGRTAAALLHFQEAVRLLPSRGKFHNNLGIVLLRLDRPAEAAPALERAIELGLGERRAYRNLAAAYARSGRADRELDARRRWVERHPRDAEAKAGLADTLDRLQTCDPPPEAP